jgi:hypothetical protein
MFCGWMLMLWLFYHGQFDMILIIKSPYFLIPSLHPDEAQFDLIPDLIISPDGHPITFAKMGL